MINALVMRFPLHHLRRQVIQRTAHRPSPTTRRMNTPPEICNLQFAIQPKKQILRLDVAMNDMLRVQVGQSISHLINVSCAPFLAEVPLPIELTIQFALRRELEHKKYALPVVEIAIQPQNIGMPEVLLYLNLATSLLLDLVLHNFVFVEGFKSEDVVRGRLGANHVNAAEFAFPKWFTNVEVAERPLSGRVTGRTGSVDWIPP